MEKALISTIVIYKGWSYIKQDAINKYWNLSWKMPRKMLTQLSHIPRKALKSLELDNSKNYFLLSFFFSNPTR